MREKKVRVVAGDITKVVADVIVNPVNAQLRPGGGVDGAIRAAAGPGLGKHLANHDLLYPGCAMITGSYNMYNCTTIVHVTPPVYPGYDTCWADNLLIQCYLRAALLAESHRYHSIAFPLLGTGAYGWTMRASAACADEAFKLAHIDLDITMVVFDPQDEEPVASELGLV